jgi:hypothetical protein
MIRPFTSVRKWIVCGRRLLTRTDEVHNPARRRRVEFSDLQSLAIMSRQGQGHFQQ